MQPFSSAAFVAAAGRPRDLLSPGPAEVAFAGRSNVGKSSAINALTGRRRLAFTSKTPGRTQTINFYELAGGARLVDLPGYGFARVSKTVRAQWEALVGAYLENRAGLAGVVQVMDARHPLTPLDEQLLGWLSGARVLILLSKCDKLARREEASAIEQVRAAVATRAGQTEVRLFSAVTRQGVEECRALLAEWLRDARASRGNKKPPVKGM